MLDIYLRTLHREHFKWIKWNKLVQHVKRDSKDNGNFNEQSAEYFEGV